MTLIWTILTILIGIFVMIATAAAGIVLLEYWRIRRWRKKREWDLWMTRNCEVEEWKKITREKGEI